jgi:putative lipoprotein
MFTGEAMKKLIIFMIALIFCGCGIASKGDGASSSMNFHIAKRVAIDMSGGWIDFNKENYDKFWRNIRSSGYYTEYKLDWIKAEAYSMVNLNIEFLKSALETYKSKNVIKTADFVSYEKNIENLVPTVSGYNTEQEYKSKMIIKQAITIYNKQLEVFKNGSKFDIYLYVMRVSNISDNGVSISIDFVGINAVGENKNDIEKHLNRAYELKQNLDSLFDKNYRW